MSLQFQTGTNYFSFLFRVVDILKSEMRKLTLSHYNHEQEMCGIREGNIGQHNYLCYIWFLKLGDMHLKIHYIIIYTLCIFLKNHNLKVYTWGGFEERCRKSQSQIIHLWNSNLPLLEWVLLIASTVNLSKRSSAVGKQAFYCPRSVWIKIPGRDGAYF